MKKLLVLSLSVLILGACGASSTKYNDLATCLSSNDVVMYGAFWCPHCQKQKKMFGASFSKIKYVECDPRDDEGQPELCLEKNIEGYPTWIFPNGERLAGEASPEKLAEMSGCPLPSEESNS